MNLSHELKLTVIIPIGFRAAWSFVHEVIIRKQTGGIVDNEPLRVSSHLIGVNQGNRLKLSTQDVVFRAAWYLSIAPVSEKMPVQYQK